MRVILDLDQEIIDAARELAAERSIPLGVAVSPLVRRGLAQLTEADRPAADAGRFPVFSVGTEVPGFDGHAVRRALAKE
jgi:hypothetical protein